MRNISLNILGLIALCASGSVVAQQEMEQTSFFGSGGQPSESSFKSLPSGVKYMSPIDYGDSGRNEMVGGDEGRGQPAPPKIGKIKAENKPTTTKNTASKQEIDAALVLINGKPDNSAYMTDVDKYGYEVINRDGIYNFDTINSIERQADMDLSQKYYRFLVNQ